MSSKRNRTRVAILALGTVGALAALALSGVVVADVLDPGATNASEGPVLSDWNPQLVNSSTVDRYQVTIRANDSADGLSLIRQRPQIQSNVTQRINMNASFGPAMNPEIVAYEGDGGPLGDGGPQERINKTIYTDNGDVVVVLSDDGQGAQQQARLTSITVEFDSLSAPNPGFYNFSVDMQAQNTTPNQVQPFDLFEETGIAQVEVVDASPADPGAIEVDAFNASSEAPQEESQLEVNATLNNTNTTDHLAADVVYGLEENVDPGYAGADLLTQTAPDVTVAAGGTANVTFFVDLTEEDEAINTSDDIRHGVDVIGNNITQPLNITDGPIDHSEDGGATLNRTTGLIQTAVDISDDGTQDVVTVNPRGSPYNENVTVPVDNITIQGNTSIGKPIVSWVGSQAPNFDPDPPFTVESSSTNSTITGLRIDPLIPDAGGVEVLGGADHSVLNNNVTGTNTGPPGVGVNVSNVIGANVSSNEIANKSYGVLFDNVDDGVVSSNTVRDNSLDGIRLRSSQRNNVTGNDVTANTPDGIRLESSSNNNVTANNASANGNDGIQLGSSIGNEVVNNDVNSNGGRGVFLFSSDDNNVTSNNAMGNSRHGIRLFSSSDGNDLTLNNASDNAREGIALTDSSDNNLTDNTVNNNGRDGIDLEHSSNNNLTDNTANGNTLSGILLTQTGSFSTPTENNNLTDNTANDNVNGNGIWIEVGNNNTLTNNTADRNDDNGIYLGGGPVAEADGNTLVDNTVTSNGGTGDSGIYLSRADENMLVNNTARNNYYGIWLVNSFRNNLTDNLAENNPEAGVYLGGTSNSANNNVLVNNTARGSAYGIWIRNSLDNTVSESLAENNDEGIEFSENSFSFSSLDASGNTFTNDTSRNNTNWDFVIETDGGYLSPLSTGGSLTIQSTNPADLPVTNLNIGNSTSTNTTLSFDGKDVEIRSNSTPPATPVGLNDTGRYFDAENITSDAFLNVSASYEDTDYTGNESDLGLYNYDATSGLWGLLPSDLDTTNNTVSSEIVDFSTFGILQQNRTANFEVNITGTNSPVQEGNNLTVDANVTNTGNDNATQVVQLEINGTVVDSQSITLGPGESTTATFVWQTQVGDNGTYTATVSSDDDNDTVPVEVLAGGVGGTDGDCIDRRNLGRGEEPRECPTDRVLQRGDGQTRKNLDRSTGRDSRTSRRDRGRSR